MAPSFLPLIDACDNFQLSNLSLQSAPVPFCLSSDPHTAIGLVFPDVVDALQNGNAPKSSTGQPGSWILLKEDGGSRIKGVCFAEYVKTPESRTKAIGELCRRWHVEGLFPDVIGGRLWRSELYPIYKNPFGPHDDFSEAGRSNKAFEMERSACALFGVVQFGVHMTIYYPEVRASDGKLVEDMKIWVPTRSKTKQTYVLSVL